MCRISILLLEDNDLDAQLVLERLRKEKFDFELTHTDSRDSFETAVASGRFDLILADHNLPDYDGASALRFTREQLPHVPFIFVSSTLGEELAIDTLKRGATDYVVKQRLDRLGPAINRALAQNKEMKRMERALSVSQERLDLVLKAAEFGLWYCDLPFDKLMWSDKVKEHFWLEEDCIVDLNVFYGSMHPDDRERTREAIERSIETRTLYDTVYRTVGPRDQVRWIRAIGSAFYDEYGQPTRFDGVTMDVTNLQAAEQERNRLLALAETARIDAENANRMKDQFLATLSHELRTPLNAILGWATLLQTGKCDSRDTHEGLAAIERNAKLQAKLIEDLLDISRIVSGTLRIDMQLVDLHEVIHSAIAAIAPAANAKGVRIHSTLDSLVPQVSGDPARLQQIIWNLLMNAVKFTPKGGHIQVLLERVNSHVEISVIDTGQGIAPDFLPYVFDRFRQADSSSRRSHGGLGLGLSIAKQLTEMHGGTIRVKSPGLDRGATFTVMLPVSAVHSSDVGQESAKRVETEATQTRPPQNVIAGVRVLVVDDETDARAVIKHVLAAENAIVEVADSCREALQKLDEFRPDVLVSDLGMPIEDGYDLIRQIRARGLTPATLPAVALTAFARSEDRRRAMLAGFQTHVAKPVEPAELVAVVASLAGRTGGPQWSSGG